MESQEKSISDLERLIDQYGTRLLRLCYLYLHDMGMAEDALQETYIKVYQKGDSFRSECSELTWITRIAINTCKDIRKRAWMRRERPFALEDMPQPEGVWDAADDTVLTAIAGLPLRYRTVVLLHYYQGLKQREIALVLDVPRSTVSVQLKRARDLLKNRLERWYFDE